MKFPHIIAVLSAIPALAAAWTPTILSRYDVHNNPDAIDFRQAGFVNQTAAWAKWNREVVTLVHQSGDTTALIQAAINQVGANGGGTVHLGPGVWQISTTGLAMQQEGVRVEGSGPGQTILYVPGANTSFSSVFFAGVSAYQTHWGSQSYPDSWVRQGVIATSEFLTADVAANSRIIKVDSPGYAVGDLLVVTGTPTTEFIAEHSMTPYWTTAMDYPAYLRTVTAVLADGYELDIPIRYPVKVRDQARCFPPTKIVRDLSVANLQILYDRNPASTFDSGLGAAQTTSATAIKFVNIENGLIEDVYMPLIPSRGIELAYSRHITVRRCTILESQNQNDTWNGYHFFVWGCDNLFRDNYSEKARRSFTPLMAMCNGNVFYHNTSVNPRFFTDYHMHLSHENLVDSHVGIGDYWQCVHRPYGAPILHGISGTQNTFWNIDSDQSTSVWSAQHGLGYVVGTSSAVNLGSSNGFAALPLDYTEGVGMREDMTPQSVYIYQAGEEQTSAADDRWMDYR
ncbi:hypothetical protein GC173_01575 [bacterium]|nr:hypothetical protein [bacterium]